MFTRDDRRMLKEILSLVKGGWLMPLDLSALTQAVNDEVTVDSSVLTLINGLAARIAALKTAQTDPATQTAINSLVSQLQAEKAKLAAAVTANTAAAETTAAATQGPTTGAH